MAFKLISGVQNYAWGKYGGDSAVAQLGLAGNHISGIDNTKPYAEFWMGTHPNCPSKLEDGTLLSNHLGGGQLPFLFKVLSVRVALSVQVHPNKKEAEVLHAKRPDLYADPNHKPEMAIALTPFECMAGFRPFSQVAAFIEQYSGLQHLDGLKNATDLEDAYARVMRASEEVIKAALERTIAQISVVGRSLTPVEDLFLRLTKQFPGDVGCFSPFFLNHLTLQPGQAVFLEANFPHAYISGDCIECMACSDNVIRAGLTPKYKDVDALLKHVNYLRQSEADGVLFHAKFINSTPGVEISDFTPPVNDFRVICFKNSIGNGSINIEKFESTHAILLIVEGSAKFTSVTADGTSKSNDVCRGSVWFVPSGCAMNFSGCSADLLGFLALANP